MITRQPQGLSVLFLSEMWERFGFYVAQSLLVLYMTKAVGFPDNEAYAITGAFTALAYIMPLIGGFMADRVLGFRRAIILGNILMAIGYGLLIAAQTWIFYLGLAFIVVGTGFFKPNISSLLGTLYEPNDPRRDSGFTIFYVGINIGIILATSSAGYIQSWLGWHASFAMAGLGLIIGLITFTVGQKRLENLGLQPELQLQTSSFNKFLRHKVGTGLAIIVMLIIATLLFIYNQATTVLFWLGTIVVSVALIIAAFRYEPVARNKLLALLILICSAIVFWAVYFQLFFSLNLFVDRNVNRQLGSIHIPTVMFIALEAIFIFLLGPIFARFWQHLAYAGRNPSAPLKFGLGTIFIGVGFFCLYLGIQTNSAVTGLTNPLWIVIAYLFVTIGELLLSPIGLATVTVLSPSNLVGMMMGVWLVSLGLGGNLAGVLAKIASVPETIKEPHLTAPYYAHAFLQYAGLAIVVGLIILALTPFIRKLIGTQQV
ncbi:MAG: peptide MFS transporter [Gammaproteobacteria bacterium]